MTNLTSLLIGFALLFAAAGCTRSKASSGDASASTANASQAASASLAGTKVTRIVFVGKEHACACTRKSVDAGWAALQMALGIPAKLPVDRLQIDTEGSKVEPFKRQKPMMALPAIYFVNGEDKVVELLQGEVREAQIAALLAR